MEFIEFIHSNHFHKHHHKYYTPDETLNPFIDFFWETNFDDLWSLYPEGFTDTLFPNIGYTYFINLANPCNIIYKNQSFRISKEAFLPRSHKITCHHCKGNKVFGIKFLASPILLEKKINFLEYQNFIYPLSYLIDQNVLAYIRQAQSFKERIEIASDYFNLIIKRNKLQKNPVFISTEIIKYCKDQKQFNLPLQFFTDYFHLSNKTIHRNFASTTGLTYKQAINLLRIRSALESQSEKGIIKWEDFGYYDNSHFLKELKKFAGPHFLAIKKLTNYTPKRSRLS